MNSPSFPAVTLRDRVLAAQDLMAAGRLDDAEALLGDVLQVDPHHAEALNALGGVALARKDAARAGQVLAAAATAFPDDAAIVNNLGIAHQMQGRLDDAIACFERAAALTPQAEAPLQSLATARFMASDGVGARSAAEQILARNPDSAEALSLLGVIAMAEGDKDGAEAHLRRALALNPDDAAALRTLSICCYDRHRFEEALHLAERARLAAPLDVDTLEHLARCQATLGRHVEAEATCRKVLAFAPNHLGLRETLARVLVLTGRPDAGVAELTAVVKANPKSAEALLALAATLRFAGRFEQALPFIEHALKLQPGLAAALDMRTELLLTLGRFPGRLDAGGDEPGQIVVPPGMRSPEFILFARFLARLAEGGKPVQLAAEDRFWPLAAHLDGGVAFAPPESARPAMALPALMRCVDLDAANVGAGVPYMRPDPELAQRWLAALDEHPRPWIGIAWESRAAGVTMARLREALPDIGTAVSVMTGPARHDLVSWPEVVDAGRHIGGFAEMIAAIANLDIVIGPDVSALHLAGALGRPGIVAVPAGYPWYWAAQAGRSLWYPTIEVLAQARPGDWQGVIEGLAERLSSLLPTHLGLARDGQS